ALSGASLTSKGVQGSVGYWFGENGSIPYLNKVKSAGAQ
ncbi:Na(+)-translocating NADH-quinone reductase subunit C, partial [Neisseria sp. P0004.S006]